MSIEVKGLTKWYGQQKAIDGISFNVARGEIVGFLGPNGAGKSTTMKIITGFLSQDEGEVTVADINVRTHPIEAKKKIGYLPEANPLYYDMYVREYLDFIAGIHHLTGKKEKITAAIEITGLTPESKKRIGQLSKGYKQRTGLAAALIHDPEVLILDEPTTGLDPNQIIEIREVIKQLGKNKTVLFSSHILQEVQAICDRVVIINKGVVVADDQVSSLQKGTRDNHVVMVEFKETPSINLMNELSDVTRLTETERGKWRIETGNAERVRKQLFELSLRHNLNIVSLQSESQSLEDVFRNLTAKK
jgi:ABC-2 type transport system ATP-binding protein